MSNWAWMFKLAENEVRVVNSDSGVKLSDAELESIKSALRTAYDNSRIRCQLRRFKVCKVCGEKVAFSDGLVPSFCDFEVDGRSLTYIFNVIWLHAGAHGNEIISNDLYFSLKSDGVI